MFDADGNKIWEATLDIYGRVHTFEGRSLKDCPFRYQGQYEDEETGLYYNRFRYYDPTTGNYLSQDPIGLNGGMQLYSYVHDAYTWIDPFGLYKTVEFPANKVIHETTIQMKGSNSLDFKAAYDPATNTAKMQLVTTADHRATFPHEGAASQFMKENNLEGKYGSPEAQAKAKQLNNKLKNGCH